MPEQVLTELSAFAREASKSEGEMAELALSKGLRELKRELVLGRYVNGEISRDEAVEQAGVDWVEMADSQKQAVLEDLQWARKPE